MKLVSVIIPVYNIEKYIEKCLLSVQKQTYKNLQIIIVDRQTRVEKYVINLLKGIQDSRLYIKKMKEQHVQKIMHWIG